MRKILLAIDDNSLPYRKNVGLYLSKPEVRKEPVLQASEFGSGAVDDGAAHFYGTVLFDEGLYRMWYYACHWGINPDWPHRKMQQLKKLSTRIVGGKQMITGPLCYAESVDGIKWTKPSLGQVLFKGNKENNALLLPHTLVSGATVIKDIGETDINRRYKMVYQFFPEFSDPIINEFGNKPTVALATSSDGICWTVADMPFINQFVEHSSFIKHDGKYIIHYHAMGTFAGHFSEGGNPCGRTGVARISSDFKYWPDLMVESFAPIEPEDKSLRGQSGNYDQVHLGVGAASFGNVCVGLYGLWHNADFDNKFGEISCDLGLLVSNDGLHFREPVKGYRFIKRKDSPATSIPGENFNTNLCQANGILNIGDETRIYHGRWRNVDRNEVEKKRKYYSAEVGLAVLARDRWGALRLNPDELHGVVCSAPISLSENVQNLSVNAKGIDGITVRLLDENFKGIKGFEKGTLIDSGNIEYKVVWGYNKLSQLTKEKIIIQVQIAKTNGISPGLYALYID